MDPEERSDEERRPKVVDKRVASGGHQPPPRQTTSEGPAQTPPPQQVQSEGGPGGEAKLTPPRPQTQSEGGSGGEAKLASGPPENETVGEPIWTPEEEAAARQMAQEIAERPGIDWVVNTAVTLANVAATKLQVGDPPDAQLCIDALAGILDGSSGRLEDAEAPLRQTLAQLQMAYAQRVAPPRPQP